MHAPTPTSHALPGIAADILARVRERKPRVHCITNVVAQNLTANVLLAAGAVPSMTVAPDEIAHFVSSADALVVNLGTLDRERRQSVEIAVDTANAARQPWVLDPVFVDRSPSRRAFAATLVDKKPTVLRLNSLEFASLSGEEANEQALAAYARDHGSIVALTGATDLIGGAGRMVKIANGDVLMAHVAGMGCAGTALTGAFLAVEPDAWLASAGGLLAFAIAGECAAELARGPGSFAVAIVDALAKLDRETLDARARLA
jgi:hydroxyethylthiazole kinase